MKQKGSKPKQKFGNVSFADTTENKFFETQCGFAPVKQIIKKLVALPHDCRFIQSKQSEFKFNSFHEIVSRSLLSVIKQFSRRQLPLCNKHVCVVSIMTIPRFQM